MNDGILTRLSIPIVYACPTVAQEQHADIKLLYVNVGFDSRTPTIQLADGTLSTTGSVTHQTLPIQLQLGEHVETISFLVTTSPQYVAP